MKLSKLGELASHPRRRLKLISIMIIQSLQSHKSLSFCIIVRALWIAVSGLQAMILFAYMVKTFLARVLRWRVKKILHNRILSTSSFKPLQILMDKVAQHQCHLYLIYHKLQQNFWWGRVHKRYPSAQIHYFTLVNSWWHRFGKDRPKYDRLRACHSAMCLSICDLCDLCISDTAV